MRRRQVLPSLFVRIFSVDVPSAISFHRGILEGSIWAYLLRPYRLIRVCLARVGASPLAGNVSEEEGVKKIDGEFASDVSALHATIMQTKTAIDTYKYVGKVLPLQREWAAVY